MYYFCSLKIMLFFVNTILCYSVTEARVLCEDMNAAPWNSHGYSCPLRCDNVLAAIQRLKVIDYKLITQQSSNFNEKLFQKDFINNLTFHEISQKRERMWLNGGFESNNIIRSKLGLRKLKLKLFKHTKSLVEKKECQNILRGNASHTLWSFIEDCARRSNTDQHQIVKLIMNILNQYGDAYFDEKMTSLLLKSLLGKDLELRHGTLDIPRVLLELSKIVHLLRTLNKYQKFSITVSPRQCLNVFVPGCYCRSGYVEYEAMCIQPEACLQGIHEMDKNYLERIMFK